MNLSQPPPMTKTASSVDIRGGKPTNTSASVNAASIAADESFVVVAGRDVLRLIEISQKTAEFGRHTGKRGRKPNLTGASTDCQCHPSVERKSLVATGATNGQVLTWDMHVAKKAPHRKFAEHSKQVVKVSWFGKSEPELLGSASLDGSVKLWDMRKASSLYTISPRCDGARELAFDPFGAEGLGAGGNGTYMAIAFDNGSVHAYDTRFLHRPVKDIPVAHSGLIMAMQWHPDLPGIIATGGRDKNIKVWELYGSCFDSSSFFRSEKNRQAQTSDSGIQPLVHLETIFNIGRLAWRPGCPRQLACSASVLHSRVHVWDTGVRNMPVGVFDAHREVVTGIGWIGSGPQSPYLEHYRKVCSENAMARQESREDDDIVTTREPVQPSSNTIQYDNNDYQAQTPACSTNQLVLTASKEGLLNLTYASNAFRPHDILRTTALDMSHKDISWTFDPLERKKYWSDADGSPSYDFESEDRKKGIVTSLRPATALNGRMIPPIPLETTSKPENQFNQYTTNEGMNASVNPEQHSQLIVDAFGPPPLWWSCKSGTSCALPKTDRFVSDSEPTEEEDSGKHPSVEYVFVKLAKGYQLEGAPVPYLCIHNAEIAASVGAHELRQVWMTIALLYVAVHRTQTMEHGDSNLVNTAQTYAQKLWEQLVQKHSSEAAEESKEGTGQFSASYRGRTALKLSSESSDRQQQGDTNKANKDSVAKLLSSQNHSSLLDKIRQDTQAFEEILNVLERTEQGDDAPPPEVKEAWTKPKVSFPQPSDNLLVELQEVVIQRIVDFYCERGDVQTCTSLGRVLCSGGGNTANLIDQHQLSQWELGYADILHRYKLWSPASTILARSHSESIRKKNQMGTSVHTACANCSGQIEVPRKQALHLAEMSEDKKLVPTVPSSCSNCSNVSLRCSICYHKVKGLFLQCIECGVGGHLACMTTWFRDLKNERNPGGIDHICIR